MATNNLGEVIRHLRKIVLLKDGAGLTDGQLMEEYLTHREDAALAALVRKHGLMVWDVCYRILRNNHDAEDAFQTTFLVLVRKAASVVPKEMVGNWLYGVANQTAMNARAVANRKRKRERQMTDMPEPEARQENHLQDLRLHLDQELIRLPNKYRAVIVLCDLEGKTRKEAARQLGVPEGTIAGQLARARTMLAKRLARHGLGLSGAALAVALSQKAASACMPPLLVSSTIKAVSLVASGKVATGVISANVIALTDGVVKSMLLTKLKTMVAVSLVVCVLGTGAGASILGTGVGADFFGGQTQVARQNKKDINRAILAQNNEPPKEFINSTGMKFVWIPPGTFMMGSPPNEEGAIKSENSHDETQHKVTLTKGFYMGVYTVTQEQWQAVMGTNPSVFKGEKNLPVEKVSWDDCQEFIKKLREKDKRPYRLPTEAEWEFACRAGTTTPFHFGKTITTDQANLNGTSYNGTSTYGNFKKGVYRGKTTPVGSFPANAWGLHDMHGNVCQWCQDRFGDYPQNDVVDPQGPDTGLSRVLRGGSFIHYPISGTSGRRSMHGPGNRNSNIGLRVAMSFTPDELKKADPPPKFIEPTSEQLEAAIKAFEKLGGHFRTVSDPHSKKTFVEFGMQPGTPRRRAVGNEVQSLDDVLKNLPKVPFSFGLNLTHTGVTDQGVKELNHLKNLWSLNLASTMVTDAGLKHIASLKDLSSLDLTGTKVTDAGMTEIANLKNLTSLYLNVTQVTDVGLKELASLENLSSLKLYKIHVTDIGLKELADLKNLSNLELSETQVTDVGLKELTGLKNLSFLTLMSTKVTDAGLKELANLNNLSLLDLSDTQVTALGLKEIANLKNLTTLGLGSTQVTDAGLKEIAKHKNLTRLYLSGTRITDAGLKEIADLKNLSLLFLAHTQVTDAGLKELGKHKNLTSLVLSFTQVTDAGVRELQQALPACFIGR